MITTRIRVFLLFLLISPISNAQITELKNWLKLSPADRPSLEDLSFSMTALSRNDSDIALSLLLADKQKRMLNEYGKQWDNRLITYDSYQMPFFYQVFGDKPADGRSLFISLHGGGGAPASVNDQQYENQQHLYDATMILLEGVYLAPRAPTNTWNLWHQSHVDEFLNIIIQLAVLKENVNPNKVYILGYSAGGDGVYQLAPRIADRWAAASMMAGHPNEASPIGLRNTPFAIHVGALDDGYNRNEKAKEWGIEFDTLQANDGQGYIHDVQIHAGLGHWMNLQDAVALPWMKNYERNPIPRKVVWKQDNVHHLNFYWLETPKSAITTGGEVLAEYNSALNEINIIKNYSNTIKLLINDKMLNIDNPVTIKYQNTVIYDGLFHRTILNIYESLSVKGDSNLAFPCAVLIEDNQTVIEEGVIMMMVTIPDQTATVGTAFRYQFPANTFSETDGDPLSYKATKDDGSVLPGWLTFDANSRTFSGTPQASDAGTLSVKVTADDGNGGLVSDSFDITIREAVLGVPAEESFSIYPNPASGYFTLTGTSGSLSSVSLTSMSGRKVRHYPASEDGRYDISELGEGIFFVFIETDSGQQQVRRIMIKR